MNELSSAKSAFGHFCHLTKVARRQASALRNKGVLIAAEALTLKIKKSTGRSQTGLLSSVEASTKKLPPLHLTTSP